MNAMKSRQPPTILIIISVLLLVIILGPFLVPVPPLTGTAAPQDLADPDSQFVMLNGLAVHLKTRGQGEPTFVLLHGFGASQYSWQAAFESLSQEGRVIAYDRPAFGLTERPLAWEGENPYGLQAQVDLLVALLDHFNIQQAVLVGHSAGGTVAMQMALQHPQRVAGLILVAPAVYTSGGAAGWLQPILATPQMRHLGPLFVRSIQTRGLELIQQAWHDPGGITLETLALYQKPLRVTDWDRALWEFTLASRPTGLADHLGEITLPTLIITGDDDRIVPTADSLRLAEELPGAGLVVISNSGHVPHEESPADFLTAASEFINTIR